jgi:hypothetical protein
VDTNFTNLNNDKLETSAAYSHPTGNGNNHIPSDGSSGQILGYASAGTAQWQAAPSRDLVDDTPPQLGGNLDGNGKNILLGFDPTPDFDADVSGSANSADALDYMKIAQGIDDNEFDHLLGVEAPWTDTTIRHEYKIIKGSSTGALREVAGTSGTDYGDLIVFGNVHSDGTNWNITTGMTIDGGNLRLIAQGEADHSTTGEASFTIDAADVVVTGTVDGRDIAANIPSSLGSAGQVLTVNSGGSAAEWGKSIAVVTALPSSPDGNTIYFVTG